eukprot:768431-Hanusia_phi.AAC.1
MRVNVGMRGEGLEATEMLWSGREISRRSGRRGEEEMKTRRACHESKEILWMMTMKASYKTSCCLFSLFLIYSPPPSHGFNSPSLLIRPFHSGSSSITSKRPQIYSTSAPSRKDAWKRSWMMMTSSEIDVSVLEAQIKEQGDKVRLMKEARKADEAAYSKEELDHEIQLLKDLKAKLDPPKAPEPVKKESASKQGGGVKQKNQQNQKEVSAREERTVRMGKAEKLREKGINPYEYSFHVSHTSDQLKEMYATLGNGEVASNAQVGKRQRERGVVS